MNTLIAAGLAVLTIQSSNTLPAVGAVTKKAESPSATATLPPLTPAPQDQASRSISLNFSQTDVSQIFRAIGMRTGANIIYSGGDKLPVTIHFNASSADEAIRGTTAAAGLAYRRVGRIYVVAKPDAMRQALSPFAERARIRTQAASADLVKSIQDVIPHASVSLGSDELIVVGIPEDVRLAQELISERVVQTGKDPRKVEVVSLGISPASKIAEVIASLYPTVKATALADNQGGGGSLALIGNPADVAEARAKALELDAATPSQASGVVIETYDVQYASATTIVEFLREAAPDVQATIAPPTFVPGALSAGATSTSGATGLGNAGATRTPTPDPSGGNQAGTQGGGAQGAGGAAGAPGQANPYDNSTRLVLKGRRADVDTALNLLRKVDAKPQQVIVDVRIVDASPTDIEKYGLKYSWDTFRFTDAPLNSTLPGQLNVTRPSVPGLITRLPFNFLATLDLMVQKTDAKLMANPTMQVLDNQEANFFIGDELSFPVTTSGALGSQNTVIEKFNIGIGLNVRARVNADGNITMRLNPIVQSLTAIQNGLPQTSSRSANTIVMVKDGETVAIGGLIRDEDTKIVQEVPFLSKLPIVGQLFRHTDRNHRRSNIIVTVTPRIVRDQEKK